MHLAGKTQPVLLWHVKANLQSELRYRGVRYIPGERWLIYGAGRGGLRHALVGEPYCTAPSPSQPLGERFSQPSLGGTD